MQRRAEALVLFRENDIICRRNWLTGTATEIIKRWIICRGLTTIDTSTTSRPSVRSTDDAPFDIHNSQRRKESNSLEGHKSRVACSKMRISR